MARRAARRGRKAGFKHSAATKKKISSGLRAYHSGRSRTKHGRTRASLPPAFGQFAKNKKDRAARQKKYGRRVYLRTDKRVANMVRAARKRRK